MGYYTRKSLCLFVRWCHLDLGCNMSMMALMVMMSIVIRMVSMIMTIMMAMNMMAMMVIAKCFGGYGHDGHNIVVNDGHIDNEVFHVSFLFYNGFLWYLLNINALKKHHVKKETLKYRRRKNMNYYICDVLVDGPHVPATWVLLPVVRGHPHRLQAHLLPLDEQVGQVGLPHVVTQHPSVPGCDIVYVVTRATFCER